MKRYIAALIIMGASLTLQAQTHIESALQAIEQNNTTLAALRQAAEAEKLNNLTGLTLADPEVEFAYLWGKPAVPGNRKDIKVLQSFDLATVSGLKSKVGRQKNQLVEWQYKADRQDILLEAKQYCLDLIYYNALLGELSRRSAYARTISAGEKQRLEKGEINRVEYNNVLLNLSAVEAEIISLRTERDVVQAQLAKLNGGAALPFDASEYEAIQMPLDFDEWYDAAESNSPALAYVRQEIEVSKKELSLNKVQGLPTLSTGYMGEFVAGQDFQGVVVGLSIPLWSNKNRVRQAKAAVQAAEARHTDAKQQFYGNLQILYHRALGLKSVADTYHAALQSADNSRLLKTAFDEGQISVLEYLVEMDSYYNAVRQALQAEREYQKAYAELSAFAL